MFTGIVEKTARVVAAVDGPKFRRLTLDNDWPDAQLGQSVAVNGVCLTIAQIGPGDIGFDVIAETLDKSNLGLLNAGDLVNLERSMRVGDRIDGHFVQGHVDGKARLLDARSTAEEWRLVIESPPNLVQYLIPKGSICIDGVSLTLAAIRGAVFEVALIPTTLKLTTLGNRAVGWPFNIEADILSKTIISWLERSQVRAEDIMVKT